MHALWKSLGLRATTTTPVHYFNLLFTIHDFHLHFITALKSPLAKKVWLRDDSLLVNPHIVFVLV